MNAKTKTDMILGLRDYLLSGEVNKHAANARTWLRECDKSLRKAQNNSMDPLLDTQEAEAAAHVAHALIHFAVCVANRMEPEEAAKVKTQLAGLNILIGAARTRSHEATAEHLRDIEIARTATARA